MRTIVLALALFPARADRSLHRRAAGNLRGLYGVIACAVALIGVGASAPAARAARISVWTTVAVQDSDVAEYTWTVLHVRAGGEADDVTLRAAPGGVSIRARAATFHVRRVHLVDYPELAKPCRRTVRHAVFCPLARASETADQSIPVVLLSTGAGDDRVRSESGTSMWVDASLGAGRDAAFLDGIGNVSGDAGADRLSRGARASWSGWLDGGPGADTLSGDGGLSGGPGPDVLLGGPRDDELSPGTGSDRVDGGGGQDQLSYDGSAAVRVDLSRGWASTAGGTARLRSIENVLTGTGDDVLIGDRHANRLDGGTGRNLIYGGGGDDHLASPATGGACGGGRDTVSIPVNADLKSSQDYDTDEVYPPTAVALTRPVPLDCERAELAYYAAIRTRPRVVGQRVEISLVSPPARHYTLIWELRAGWRHGGKLLGKTKVTARPRRVAIPLNALGKRCLATVTCRVSLTVGEGNAIDEDATSVLPLVL